MIATRFLLAIFLVVSTSEVRRVLSSEAAANLTLQTLLKKNCDSLKTRLACLSSPYRTFDGSCNNLCNTTLGMAGTTLARFPNLFRPTAYDDPVTFTARQTSAAVSFRVIPLPNARNVSVQVFDSSEADATGAPAFTHLTMTWGQFLDHDVTLTELTPLPENVTCGTNEAACVVDGQNCIGVDIIHPSPFGPSQTLGGLPTAKCIPLRRSTRTPEGEQINIITHHIDGSQVYGSDSETAEELRDPIAQIGLLDVRPFSRSGSLAQPVLPPQEEELFCRSPDPENIPCLRGGDERANENQALTAMHTVWVREHNRVAKVLHTLNPTWDDERLFQEARKIVIAEIQHITYNEWLPVLFSEETRRNAGVLLEARGQFFTGYDPHVSPAMFNVFSTAALRMGHTLIRGEFQLDVRGSNNANDPELNSGDFFNPAPLFEKIQGFNPYGLIIRGLALDPAHEIDFIFTPEVRENLIIEGPGNGIFGDLMAINIQRGRDHGIPGYIEFIEACGGQKPLTFPALLNFMSQSQINRLKQVYTSTVDIDVFAGAMSETRITGSQFGFTFNCILLQQFKNSRFGDRFWYERDDHEVAFNAEQLDAIRNATMARVLCDNADDVTRIQPKAFVRRDNAANDDILCDDIETVDLTPFKEMEEEPAQEQTTVVAV